MGWRTLPDAALGSNRLRRSLDPTQRTATVGERYRWIKVVADAARDGVHLPAFSRGCLSPGVANLRDERPRPLKRPGRGRRGVESSAMKGRGAQFIGIPRLRTANDVSSLSWQMSSPNTV